MQQEHINADHAQDAGWNTAPIKIIWKKETK